MKKMKRMLSVLLAMLMVFGMTSAILAADVTFTDVAGHWGWTRGYIPYLVEKDVLNGYKQNDGTYKFKPDGEVTRAEFIKMLDETFGLLDTKKVSYSDVSENDWFYPYFAKAAAQGYALDYGTSADPNGKLTRQEATSLLVRYLGLSTKDKASTSQFTDYTTISKDFRDYVLTAAKADLINGYEQNDGSYMFKPYNTLTRAEALTILYRAAGCIFNKNATSRDKGANPDGNNVITRGVTVKNVTMNGRNIVTEGVGEDLVTLTNVSIPTTLTIRGGSEVALDKCSAKNIVVENGAKLTLANGTKVDSVTLSYGSALSVFEGTEIGELYVATASKNLKITGAGKIRNAKIYASGVESSILPDEYEIASGYKATFAGKTYTGKSTAKEPFAMAPFVTSDGAMQYLNVKANATGRLYYYYSKSAKAVPADEFDSNSLENAAVADYENVTKDKYETFSTFKISSLAGYRYIVLQLRDDTTVYDPIVIDAEAAEGTGFETEPYLDSADAIKFTADEDGTVLAYYAEDAAEVTQMKFLETYDGKESAFKYSASVKDGKSVTFPIEERYLSNYPNVIFMLIDEDGLYYEPVVVATGDDGFLKDPVITTPGTVDFTTNVDGMLYYYFTESKTLPSAAQFYTAYSAASDKSKTSVDRKLDDSISYTAANSRDYKYIVLAIKTDGGEWLQPVMLEIDISIGFSSLPELTNDDHVRIYVNDNGKVYYYYAKKPAAPTSAEFNRIYDGMSNSLSGRFEVSKYMKTKDIALNVDLIEDYPYMILMFVSDSGVEYTPVTVGLQPTYSGVFSVAPACKDGMISFKTTVDGELYAYYAKGLEQVTNNSYYLYWQSSKYHAVIPDIKSGVAKTFPVDDDAIDAGYTYVIVAFRTQEDADADKLNAFSTPIALKLNGGGSSSSTGLSIIPSSSYVTATAACNGTMYWLLTDDDDLVEVAAGNFRGAYIAAEASGSRDDVEVNDAIRINGDDYKYLVICMKTEGEYLKPVTHKFEVVENNSGLTGGIYTSDISDEEAILVWRGKASVAGTITPYILLGNRTMPLDLGTKVAKDSSTSITITVPMGAFVSGQGELKIYLQLTDGDGEEYPMLQIFAFDPNSTGSGTGPIVPIK